ncbi:MAG: hypothetical protein ACFFDQ_12830 [Candidatus Thorarchaeota archaeon]
MQTAVFIIWIIAGIWMGFFFMELANTWPDLGSGPHPSMFVWIPFAIAGVGALAMVVQIVNIVNERDKSKHAQEFSTRTYPYDDTPSTSTQMSGHSEPESIYRTPPFCSQCGAALDPELVEWIGPIRFRCPSCGKTGKAEESQF